LPDKLTSVGVNRVHVCSEVAKVECEFRFSTFRQRADSYRRAQTCTRFDRPVGTACLCIQTEELARFGGDKQSLSDDRRLTGGHRTGMTPGPLYFQSRHVGRADTWFWLIARVVEISSPTVPLQFVKRERRC